MQFKSRVEMGSANEWQKRVQDISYGMVSDTKYKNYHFYLFKLRIRFP